MTLAATLASRARNRLLRFSNPWRFHTQRTPAAEIGSPPVAPTHWPHVTAPTPVALTPRRLRLLATSGTTRFLKLGWRRLNSGNAASPPSSYSSLNRQKLSRLYPMTLQACCNTLPNCFGHLQYPYFYFDHFLRGIHLVASFYPHESLDNEDSNLVSD